MPQAIIALGLACLAVLTGCGDGRSQSPSPSPSRHVEHLVFAYGIGARNVLDTGAGTFTKDLIADPPVTAPLRLSDEELARIERKMEAIRFWSYPEVYETAGDGGRAEPHPTYRWEVTTTDGVTVVRWEDAVFNDDPRAADLRSLADLIRRLVERQPEYEALPEPSGAYL